MAHKKRILVVDDDDRMTNLLAEFCADLGYDVKTVNQGAEAVSVALLWRPDLITLDLEMPDMDGLEVLRGLRSWEQLRSVPVVIISVVAEDTVNLPESVQAWFSKPLKLKTLNDQIERLLQPSGEK